MHNATLTPELEALLVEHGFHDPFTAAAFADLRRVLRHAPIDRGTLLLRQGDPDRDVYLVLRGRLGVRAEHADGTSTLVDEVGPGGIVGEMALLTGQPRTATVYAREPSDLARVSREDFEGLAEKHPQALNEFLRRIVPRMRGTQLVHLLTEIFGHLDRNVLSDIAAQLEWTQLPSGRALFHQGDDGDDVYLVSHGRLRVVAADGEGGERVLEEVGRGSTIGDIALLTGERRAATVHAVRDTYLLRLSRSSYEALLVRHPLAMLEIARRAVVRLRHASRQHMERSSRPVTFAVIPAGPDAPYAAFADRLAATLVSFGRTLVLGAADVDRLLAKPGIAQSAEDTVVHESLNQWLGTQENGHDASRARAIVQRRGLVWKVVRASTALPAIFPPVLGDDGEVLVDGCVMNNMPLDVMRELCEGGTVLGVNPMPTRDKDKRYDFGPSISGWRALLARFGIMTSGMRAPLILGSVMRATEINSANRMRQAPFRALADVLIEPALESYAILAFDQYAPIIDIGYHAAKADVASWQCAMASP